MNDRNGRMHWLIPLIAAALATALNAAKPPLIDDPAYYAMARQIARAPSDPYGFDQFWYNSPQPANEILAPPVIPYWLGFGIRIVGDHPVRLKFWLYPIMALFACAWYALLRRFARSAATPILLLTLASPVLIPNWNFMLDIPAAAFSLTAIALFFRALERNRLALALLAGLVAGIAAETKYTGGLTWPLVAIAAIVWRLAAGPTRIRRLALAAVALACAAGVFVAWESFVHQKYGHSHFLFHLGDAESSLLSKLRLLPSLVLLLGGMLPAAAAAVLMGLRWQRGFTAYCSLIVIGYAAIFVIPGTSRSAWATRPGEQRFDVAAIVFTVLGSIAAVVVIIAAGRLLTRWRHWRPKLRSTWPGMFLAGWLALEIAGFFAMTPFPATRRVLGIVLIATLLAARLLSMAARHCNFGLQWLAIVPGCALGLLYNGLVIRESALEPAAVRTAVAEIRRNEPNARIWYVGHWGFQFEAERLGLQPVVPNRSQLSAGDWLLWPDPGCVTQQDIEAEPALGPVAAEWELRHPLPLRAVPPYYGGHLPLERWPHPQLVVRAYRVRAAWAPRSP